MDSCACEDYSLSVPRSAKILTCPEIRQSVIPCQYLRLPNVNVCLVALPQWPQYAVRLALGLCLLCEHNIKHNRYTKETGIIMAGIIGMLVMQHGRGQERNVKFVRQVGMLHMAL